LAGWRVGNLPYRGCTGATGDRRNRLSHQEMVAAREEIKVL
jgi:hypothetical protein